MKLSCALVLTLTNLVIATPFHLNVKGSGLSSIVNPASATFGTFGLVQPVASKTEYPGTYPKPSSASFAANGASESSGSYTYNAAQGKPSVAYNTGAGFGAPGQVVSQNVGVKPQVLPTTVPCSYNTGSEISGFPSSEGVNGSPVNTNTASDSPAGQQSGIYLGSTSHVSGFQGNKKPNTFVSGSQAYTPVSDSSSSKGVYGVQANTDTTSQFQNQLVATEQKPGNYLGSNAQASVSQDISKPNGFVSSVTSKEHENFKGSSAIHGFSSSLSSGSVNSVPTTQAQSTPTVEQKPVYSSGFGGPPGVLSPYDKASFSDIHKQSSNSYSHQQNAQISESVNSTPQDVYYTPLNNPKPSYASQQQQTVTVKPSGGNYYATNAESSYKPEIKPAYQNENKPVLVNTNERPSSEFKPSKDVHKNSYQKPEVKLPQKPEGSLEYASQTGKPGYQISIQAYPAKETEKVEPTKKPLYTGGFGAPAGVLEPIQSTHSEVHKFASTTVKPEQYKESKPTVSYTQTVTNVNKYSSFSETANPTEKPYFENTNYQSHNVGSSPASYVTFKPTGSINYSEKDSATSSFSVSSISGTVEKGEGQVISKPYNTISVTPTYSTWEQNPTQATNTNVASGHKLEQTSVPFDKTRPSGTVVTSQKEIATVSEVEVPSHLSEQVNDKEITSPSFGTIKPSVPQNSAVHSNAATGFVSVSQQTTNKPSFEGSSDKIPAFAFSGNPLTITHANKPSIAYFEQKETQKPNTEVNNKETPSKVSVFASNTFSDKIEAQYPKKPSVTNQNKPHYSSSFGTLTGSTGYEPSSHGQESTFVTGSNDKVSQINFGTTVKPFVKPELSFGSQSTTVPTSSASQNTDKKKHTDNTFVQNKPSVVTSEGQKFTNQAFTTNSAFASGATAFGSKPQYQLPTIQPGVQKNTWHTNSFGTFGTAKPHSNYYPGFTSSFTTYGQDSSQDKTKQTNQITSTGQYIPFQSSQFKPYTTGQYKPYNWGSNVRPSYQKFSNVYPTGGTFVSTYAPTTFKPFVTTSPFDKSKTSSSFSATVNNESTYASGIGSPLSVTTAKPSSLTQTSYKPVPESTSSFGQSSFNAVKPTGNFPSTSAQFNSETVRPSVQSSSEIVDFNSNKESGLTAEVKVDEKIQFSQTSKPYWSSNLNQKESSAGAEVTPNGLKPTEQPFLGTSSYSINKEVTPTQVSSKKPSSYGTYTVDTVSSNKDDKKNQYSQTPKPEWSADYNQKESSLFASVGGASESLKPSGQPSLGTYISSVEKWSSTPTAEVTHKPEFSSSFEQSKSDSVTVSKSEDNSKPLSATGNPQDIPYEIHVNPGYYVKPTAQVSDVEKKPDFVGSYKEKDTNQASFVTTFAKPTVPSEYGTDVKVTSKYTDGPAKVPTSFIHSTQIPHKPTDTQTNQQTLGFNSNTVAPQPTHTSYEGGFGGSSGILKPNDFSSHAQQQFVQTQYKPNYNNQVPWVNQQNSPSGANAASYFGGHGASASINTASESVKPNGFGYVQDINKHTAYVQAQKDVNQLAVFESQASAGGQSNAGVNSNTHGFLSNHHHIQNPFNGGVSTGTGFANNDYKPTGQFSTAQSSAGRSTGYQGVLSTLL